MAPVSAHRLTSEQISDLRSRLQAGEPAAAIARAVGTTRATVSHYARQLGLVGKPGRPPVEDPADHVLKISLTAHQMELVRARGGGRWAREVLLRELGL